jgi:hypothetical protein
MIKPLQAATGNLLLISVVMIWGLSACAPGLEKKQGQLDTASIQQIEFKIGTIKQASLTTTLDRQDMIARISANLAGWGYPIGNKDNRVFSHRLSAEIGAIEHSGTPTGFSFSAGNSDPRALDFQKKQRSANQLRIGFQYTARTNCLSAYGFCRRKCIDWASYQYE